MQMMNLFRLTGAALLARQACTGLLALAIVPACATELVYTPVNPSFGGSPLNASGLLAIAAAQNGYKAPTASPLEKFNNSLQQAILNRLSQQSLATIFGKNSTLVPGTYDTLAYSITITDMGSGLLKITTTDKSTGAQVSFEVSSTELTVEP
jgi:curli production assembly/transport component CsgF